MRAVARATREKPEAYGRAISISYDPSLPSKLLSYFSNPPLVKTINASGKEDRRPKFPTIAGFCVSVGIHRQRIWEWAKHYQDLSDALSMVKEYQEDTLVDKGLHGEFQATMSIFALKNVAGWRDTIVHQGDKENPIELLVAKRDDLVQRLNED